MTTKTATKTATKPQPAETTDAASTLEQEREELRRTLLAAQRRQEELDQRGHEAAVRARAAVRAFTLQAYEQGTAQLVQEVREAEEATATILGDPSATLEDLFSTYVAQRMASGRRQMVGDHLAGWADAVDPRLSRVGIQISRNKQITDVLRSYSFGEYLNAHVNKMIDNSAVASINTNDAGRAEVDRDARSEVPTDS